MKQLRLLLKSDYDSWPRSGKRIGASAKRLTVVTLLSLACGAWAADYAAQQRVDQGNIERARYQLMQAGRAADELAAYLEEYGSISVSAPLFFEPTNNFAFGMHRGSSNYFNEAKTQIEGASSVSEQVANGFGLSAEAQFDPTLTGAYGSALTDYMKQVGARGTKTSLLTSAAEMQLHADLVKASQETNLVTRAQLISGAYSNYANAYPASTNSPKFPTASDVNANLPGYSTNAAGRPDVRDVFSSSNFSAAGQLIQSVLNTTSPTINNRVALNVAAGDVATEAIFNLLLDPEKVGQFSGQKILFGMTTVAVNPGWRTQRDFSGDINVAVKVDFQEAGDKVLRRLLENRPDTFPSNVLAKLAADANIPFSIFKSLTKINAYSRDEYARLRGSEKNPKHPHRKIMIPEGWDHEKEKNAPSDPMVVAATPGMDVETLDLASSYRRQFEMSLKLAVAFQQAGMKGAANTFFNHASRLESDFRTRTPIPIINTYSVTGAQFGFQIGPRFQALDDPDERKAKGAQILHRQWFPAIVIVGIDDSNLRPLVQRDEENGKVYYRLYEPIVDVTPVTRWLRINHSAWKRFQPRPHEQDYLWMSHVLNRDYDNFTNTLHLINNVPGDLSRPAGLLEKRVAALRQLAFITGARQVFSPEELIPGKAEKPKAAPVVTGTEPAEVRLSRDQKKNIVSQKNVFVIQGKSLKQIDKAAITAASGDATVNNVLSQTDDLIVLEATVSSKKAPLVFELRVKDDAGKVTAKLYTKPIAVVAEPKKVPPLPVVFKEVTTTGNGKQICSSEIQVQLAASLDTNTLHLIQNMTTAPTNNDKLAKADLAAKCCDPKPDPCGCDTGKPKTKCADKNSGKQQRPTTSTEQDKHGKPSNPPQPPPSAGAAFTPPQPKSPNPPETNSAMQNHQ